MTIKTRDEKFKDSFSVYMNNLEINNIRYNLDYSLINKTSNKTRCVHEYKLEIFGTAESLFNTGENVVDILPTTNDLVQHMENYFEPYEISGVLSGGRRQKLSYIYVYTRSNEQEIVSSLEFDVVYHKDHLPFPVTLTELEKCHNEILEWKDKADLYKRRYDVYKRKYLTERDHIKNIQTRLQDKMSKIYAETTVLQDCPVCYEPIQKENIRIPLCFHYICSNCRSRCDKCPLCREKYEFIA